MLMIVRLGRSHTPITRLAKRIFLKRYALYDLSPSVALLVNISSDILVQLAETDVDVIM